MTFLKIKDKLYNSNIIKSVEINNYIPMFCEQVSTYDININFISGDKEYLEFDTAEERDIEFNKIRVIGE